LFTLPGLKVLDLSGNRITQVSSSIGELASLEMLNLQNSPLDGGSLLGLRRTLPQAQINYFDTNFGLNFASKPLPPNLRPQFKRLFLACDRNDPNAYYELGQFFEKNGDYGLAEKAFRAVADNRDLEGTGKSVTCLLRMAEIYDDIKGEKSYLSPYKRKVYADYSDYSSTSTNNRAYNIYIQISGIQTRDNVARLAQKKANARINVICNDMADNLQRIFEANNSEIERLIGSSGDMQNLSAAGDKIMNDSQVQGSQGAALFGAAVSIFGKVSSSVKDDKAARLKRDNLSLKEEIADLRSKASHYMSK
jgi:tetratricopeptide (TPR) repeat protein